MSGLPPITGQGGLGPGLTPRDLHLRASLLQELAAGIEDPVRLKNVEAQLLSLDITSRVNRGETVTFTIYDPDGYDPNDDC
jgi:hypothetical protein